VLVLLEVDVEVIPLGEAVDIVPTELLEETLGVMFPVVVICPMLWVVAED
jgi:hypothetical protein